MKFSFFSSFISVISMSFSLASCMNLRSQPLNFVVSENVSNCEVKCSQNENSFCQTIDGNICLYVTPARNEKGKADSRFGPYDGPIDPIGIALRDFVEINPQEKLFDAMENGVYNVLKKYGYVELYALDIMSNDQRKDVAGFFLHDSGKNGLIVADGDKIFNIGEVDSWVIITLDG